jgi:hypothetical protein
MTRLITIVTVCNFIAFQFTGLAHASNPTLLNTQAQQPAVRSAEQVTADQNRAQSNIDALNAQLQQNAPRAFPNETLITSSSQGNFGVYLFSESSTYCSRTACGVSSSYYVRVRHNSQNGELVGNIYIGARENVQVDFTSEESHIGITASSSSGTLANNAYFVAETRTGKVVFKKDGIRINNSSLDNDSVTLSFQKRKPQITFVDPYEPEVTMDFQFSFANEELDSTSSDSKVAIYIRKQSRLACSRTACGFVSEPSYVVLRDWEAGGEIITTIPAVRSVIDIQFTNDEQKIVIHTSRYLDHNYQVVNRRGESLFDLRLHVQSYSTPLYVDNILLLTNDSVTLRYTVDLGRVLGRQTIVQTFGFGPSVYTESAKALDSGLGLIKKNNNYHENWGGRGEKWVFSNQENQWYFLVPEENRTYLYRWDGSNQATGSLKAILDITYHTIPSKLHDALSPSQGDTVERVAFQLDQHLQLRFKGRYAENWGGQGEKWMWSDKNKAWYFVKPNGELYKWNGQSNLSGSALVAVLDANYHTNPASLHNAPPPQETLTQTLERIGHLNLSYYQRFDNWGGRGEKWLLSGGVWYFITSDGKLFQWTAGTNPLAGQLTGIIGSSYWNYPASL